MEVTDILEVGDIVEAGDIVEVGGIVEVNTVDTNVLAPAQTINFFNAQLLWKGK